MFLQSVNVHVSVSVFTCDAHLWRSERKRELEFPLHDQELQTILTQEPCNYTEGGPLVKWRFNTKYKVQGLKSTHNFSRVVMTHEFIILTITGLFTNIRHIWCKHQGQGNKHSLCSFSSLTDQTKDTGKHMWDRCKDFTAYCCCENWTLGVVIVSHWVSGAFDRVFFWISRKSPRVLLYQ
jgi:hypothetical protein